MDILEQNSNEEQETEENQVVVINNNDALVNARIAEIEARKRRLRIAEWAEDKSIINGVPTVEGLNRVWRKLRKGKRLAIAIRGICSVTTWRKWREEYPEIASMEEQCREERIARLEEEILEIADSPDRDRMGQVSKDRLRIDARQNEINRLDRLTEARLNLEIKNKPIVPIQINVKYGKPKPGDPDYVPEEDTTRTEGQKFESNTTDNNK